MNNLYSKYDLRDMLKLSVATIDNKMKDGSIKFYKIGKSVRFDDEQINEFLKDNYKDKYTARSIGDEYDGSRLLKWRIQWIEISQKI